MSCTRPWSSVFVSKSSRLSSSVWSLLIKDSSSSRYLPFGILLGCYSLLDLDSTIRLPISPLVILPNGLSPRILLDWLFEPTGENLLGLCLDAFVSLPYVCCVHRVQRVPPHSLP